MENSGTIKNDRRKEWAKYFFVILGVIFIYLLALRAPTDPDMGWHLMDGKYLEEHNFQAAKVDIFSHSMPDYPLIMHEWVHDIMMYKLYLFGSFFGLTFFYAFIATIVFLVAAWGVRASLEYKIIAAILGMIAGGYVLGVKAQTFSLLGLALTVFIIFRFRQNYSSKAIYFFPFLFLVWVNFHGGFSVGLFFIGVFLFFEYVKNSLLYLLRKSSRLEKVQGWLEANSVPFRPLIKLNIILILSFLATLVNPYGWRIYIEVVTTLTDSYVKTTIGEWLPIDATSPFAKQFMFYLVLLGILLILSFRKIDYSYLAIAIIFLYMAFSSWRHMPLFVIISIPLWVSVVEHLAGKELTAIICKKWFMAFFLLAVAAIGYQRLEITPPSYSLERLSKEGGYPLGAVEYLRKNTKPGNLFNEYNWGGFLIWQYPERKVYIDGRMAIWKIGDRSIYREFNDTMMHASGWEKTLQENNISQALVYNNPANELAYTTLGWKAAYRDNLAVIFEKPEGQ